MRIALTGAAGFVGSFIARHLSAAGHRVTAVVRPESRQDHIAPYVDRLIEGDLAADDFEWPGLFHQADCVVHSSVDRRPWDDAELRPLNLHLHSNLLTSIKLLRASRPRPFIFISSLAVHRDLADKPTDTDPDNHDLPGAYYAAYKASVEAHLKAEHGRDCITVRPGMVYGIDPRLERSRGYDIIQAIKRGEPIRQSGWGIFVHADDVAAAVTAIVANPSAAARAYDLADCHARMADVAAMAAEVLGVKAQIDFAGPAEPPVEYSTDAARSLGIPLNRGHDGIRQHLRELAALLADG